MSRIDLTPLGTVKRRLGAPQVKGAPYPEWLVAAVRERDLGDDTIYLAWELSRCASHESPEEREAWMAVAVVSLATLKGGSSCLPLDALEKRVRALADSGGAPSTDELVRIVAKLVKQESDVLGRPGDEKPFIVDGGFLYHQRVHRRETSLAERMKRRLSTKVDRGDYIQILDALDRVLAHRPVVRGRVVRLSADQQHAVRAALTQSLTLVCGGPGTGKTSVVVSILRVLARMKFPIEKVALTAPTGKAARRMAESIRTELAAVPEPKIVDAAVLEALAEPRTLHRLLDYSPARRRFRFNEDRLLPFEIVIVDEASMIDLETMEALVRAVPPEAKLVFLGDPAQLPSVHAGSMFSDLVAAGRDKVSVELDENFRIDRKDTATRDLSTVCEAIRSGDPTRLDGAVTARQTAADVLFRGVELLERDRESFFERWFQERFMIAPYAKALEQRPLDTSAVLQHLRRHGILCVTHHDVDRVNRFFRGKNPSRIGEPVIVTRNDYERGLFNGETGVRSPTGLHFETGTFGDLGAEAAPAYAITVHKSQGSELDHVAIVLPSGGHPLLTRELLYTAVSRARRSVTILGDRVALTGALARTLDRSSGILRRLA